MFKFFSECVCFYSADLGQNIVEDGTENDQSVNNEVLEDANFIAGLDFFLKSEIPTILM